jgi:hypothetical protein
MKKALLFIIITLFSLGLAVTAFAESGKMDLKVDQEVYACNCGASCPCNTMSMKEGNCACGNKMVKAKVVKVEEGVVYLQEAGWEKPRAFKTQGKYTCACGPSCNCGTISQNPGKCVCGTDMKPVEMKPAK